MDSLVYTFRTGLIHKLGKSVICSKIIGHIRDDAGMAVAFFFCSHLQSSQRWPNEVLRSLSTQLLVANTGLAPYILETFANNGLRATKKSLGVIIEKLISSLSQVRIIVDGLDECAQNEHGEIIEDLLKIKGPTAGACKVLISSRKFTSISKLLRTKAVVRLDDYPDHVNVAISSFVHARLCDLHLRFNTDIVEELGRQIIAKANGEYAP